MLGRWEQLLVSEAANFGVLPRASLEAGVRLFEDADSDGRLSDSEADPEDSLAAPE
jgi:hypothetical protein